MKAIETGLRNPYLVVVVVLAVLVVGGAAFTRIPADLLPIFKTPAVQIITFYPGMPPEVMERDIMSRLERWTGQSVGISHQEGKSMMGVSIVKDFFREDISFDTAMSQVTSYAMSDLYYLPPGTIPPMVMPFDPTASAPLCLVTVSSPTMSEKELYDVAYFELRNRLQSIQGVIAPAVYGGVLRRILAYVDRDELEVRNLAPLDIARAIQKQNVLVPTGNAKFGDIDYQIVSNAMAPEVRQINDFPIKTDGEAVVFMRDIGETRDSHQIQSNIVRINGRRQVYIPIYRQPGANTIAIVDAIKTQLDQILQRLKDMDERAADLNLSLVMDQSTYVRGSLRALQIEAGLGALMAGLVVLVFLRSVRATLIAVVALPFSLLAAFIGMYFTGDTLNSMSLGGLALAIGIILDQAIVVLENISRRLEMGKSRFEAAFDGAREVALPVFVAVVTFAVVFFPVVFLTGIGKFLFEPLALAVIFAIGASFIVAVFILPSLCMRFLKTGQHGGSEQHASGWVPRLFDRVLPPLLKARYLVIGGAALAFAGAVLVILNLGQELFPAGAGIGTAEPGASTSAPGRSTGGPGASPDGRGRATDRAGKARFGTQARRRDNAARRAARAVKQEPLCPCRMPHLTAPALTYPSLPRRRSRLSTWRMKCRFVSSGYSRLQSGSASRQASAERQSEETSSLRPWPAKMRLRFGAKSRRAFGAGPTQRHRQTKQSTWRPKSACSISFSWNRSMTQDE